MRRQRAYRHEALFWRTTEEFLACTVPFIRDGLTAGEAVMVAVVDSRTRWLREALGADADEVHFVDMSELGRHPARIIPAVRTFLDEHVAKSQVRGIGEPIWSGRRSEEVLECQLQEALLNVAVQPDTPFWLLCPYDAGRLEESAIEEAYRSHPAVVTDQQYRGSHLYGGAEHVRTLWGSALPVLDGPYTELAYDRATTHEVSSFVTAGLHDARVGPARAADLAGAVAQLAAASLRRGAGGGTVRCWRRPEAITFEVSDPSTIADPMVGRRLPSKDRRHPLWNAGEECDLVQVRSNASGTTVRVHLWLPAPQPHGAV